MPSITFDAFRGSPVLVEARHREDNERGTVYALTLTLGSAFDAPKIEMNGLTADDLVRLVDACTACLQDGAEETVSLDEIIAGSEAYPFGRADGE